MIETRAYATNVRGHARAGAYPRATHVDNLEPIADTDGPVSSGNRTHQFHIIRFGGITVPFASAEDVIKIAQSVARRYARRSWWASVDDLTGEACRAVLEAKRTFDPQVGVPFAGYAQRAAVKALKVYLWRNSSPVSEKGHRLTDLAGVHKAAVEVAEIVEDEKADIVEQLDGERWRSRVRSRLMEIAATTKNGTLATAVLLEERQPNEITEAPRKAVYSATHLVRRKMREDYELYNLHKEK